MLLTLPTQCNTFQYDLVMEKVFFPLSLFMEEYILSLPVLKKSTFVKHDSFTFPSSLLAVSKKKFDIPLYSCVNRITWYHLQKLLI